MDKAIQAWQELGFYCDYDGDHNSWCFLGSQTGLTKFVDLLKKYANNVQNQMISEHEHIGPYMLLKIMTWDKPKITSEGIAGPLMDILKLANLVETHLSQSKPGDCFTIGEEYCKQNHCKLIFYIKEKDFDPSTTDPFIKWGN